MKIDSIENHPSLGSAKHLHYDSALLNERSERKGHSPSEVELVKRNFCIHKLPRLSERSERNGPVLPRRDSGDGTRVTELGN